MGLMGMLALALATGLTIGGVTGSVMEALTKTRLGFVEPFVSSEFVLLSVLATVVTGPFMLTNEALVARKSGSVGAMSFLGLIALAALWATATGILVVELAAFAIAS